MTHPMESVVKTTMEQLRQMADVSTIVGAPVFSDGETVIMPIGKVSLGLLSGGGEYPLSDKAERKNAAPVQQCEGALGAYPFAGASAAGVSVTPIAFLTVHKGKASIQPTEIQGATQYILTLLPDLIERIGAAVGCLAKRSHDSDPAD